MRFFLNNSTLDFTRTNACKRLYRSRCLTDVTMLKWPCHEPEVKVLSLVHDVINTSVGTLTRRWGVDVKRFDNISHVSYFPGVRVRLRQKGCPLHTPTRECCTASFICKLILKFTRIDILLDSSHVDFVFVVYSTVKCTYRHSGLFWLMERQTCGLNMVYSALISLHHDEFLEVLYVVHCIIFFSL